MPTREPLKPIPPAVLEVLNAYDAGQLSPDEAAIRYVDELERSGVRFAAPLDRPLREALLRLAIARGRVPPGTVLEPEE